jgi:hypothetical protein
LQAVVRDAQDDTNDLCYFKVPHGARAVRFLPLYASGGTDWSTGGTFAFSVHDPVQSGGAGVIKEAPMATVSGVAISVPPDAGFLTLSVPSEQVSNIVPWIEWTIAPATVSGPL